MFHTFNFRPLCSFLQWRAVHIWRIQCSSGPALQRSLEIQSRWFSFCICQILKCMSLYGTAVAHCYIHGSVSSISAVAVLLFVDIRFSSFHSRDMHTILLLWLHHFQSHDSGWLLSVHYAKCEIQMLLFFFLPETNRWKEALSLSVRFIFNLEVFS